MVSACKKLIFYPICEISYGNLIGPRSQADENLLQEVLKAHCPQGISVQEGQGLSLKTGKEKI